MADLRRWRRVAVNMRLREWWRRCWRGYQLGKRNHCWRRREWIDGRDVWLIAKGWQARGRVCAATAQQEKTNG